MMLTVGVILWIVFVAWLISNLSPSQEMRRSSSGNYVYYILWMLVFGGLILLHYQLMASMGHTMLAWVGDMTGICLGSVRLWMSWRFQLNRRSLITMKRRQ